MRRRVLLLFIILSCRYILNYIDIDKYMYGRMVSVAGNVLTCNQSISGYVLRVGRFWIAKEGYCPVVSGEKISIVGRINYGVIDRFEGRIWLSDAKIDKETKGNVQVLNLPTNPNLWSNCRMWLAGIYKRFLPDPEAGLVAGIVLGDKKGISSGFNQQMIKSGTIHIAVASGYNVMVIGGAVLSLLFWTVRRQKATWIAIGVMVCYAFLSGGEPPVMRAVGMGAIIFVGQMIGRGSVAWWSLLLVSWLMILIDPFILESASFQLSVMASVGLLVVSPWLEIRLSEKLREIGAFTGLTTSVSTMIMTMPVIWWHFGRVGWIGLLSNALVLPVVPMIMLLGGFTLILPWVFTWPTYVLAHWVVMVIKILGS